MLDLASGTAGVALQLASRTGARVVGVDLTEGMLRQGQANVAGAGLASTIGLVAGKAEQLPFPDASFDALTFTYLLRYVDDPQATLTELARVVKPGATMASLEFCVPPAAFWRASWVLYTRLILPAGGLLLGGRPGCGWASSSDRTSPATTAAIPSHGRSRRGGGPVSPACGPGS